MNIPSTASPSTAGKKTLIVILLLLLLLAGGAIWFLQTHLVVGLTCCRYDAEELDLRGRSVSVEKYETISRKLSRCRITWDVPLSAGRFDSESTELTLSELTEEDLPLFAFFPGLETVEVESTDRADLAARLQAEYPAVEVGWRVPFGGGTLSGHSTVLTVPADELDMDALGEVLSRLPDVREISVTGEPLSEEAERELLALDDSLSYRYPISLLGETVSSLDTRLSFAGQSLSREEQKVLWDSLDRFPALEVLDLTGCGVDEMTILFQEAAAGIEIVREMSVYGVTFSSEATEIDFSDRSIWDKGAELETLLPELRHLEKVIMCNCGIRNEDMDALNQRYDSIRFVWTVYFSIFSCRTDATEFICARILNNHATLYSGECEVFKYCPDLIALDLGHKNITDLSFLYYLPHLKYLILAENDVPDLTPIGSLQELTYLEIFWTKPMDLTPLANCKGLTDLNISYTWARADNAYETLMQMPRLERLWYCGSYLTEEQLEDIRAVMPDCEMYLERMGEPTGGGWREHPHYYEMRDAFEMYYMPGGTNGVDENGNQIIVG